MSETAHELLIPKALCHECRIRLASRFAPTQHVPSKHPSTGCQFLLYGSFRCQTLIELLIFFHQYCRKFLHFQGDLWCMAIQSLRSSTNHIIFWFQGFPWHDNLSPSSTIFTAASSSHCWHSDWPGQAWIGRSGRGCCSWCSSPFLSPCRRRGSWIRSTGCLPAEP